MATILSFIITALFFVSQPARVFAQDCEAERCAAEAAIAAACPCDSAENHGDYVSCVADAVEGLVSEECRGAVVRCAARSTCGKEGAVACLKPKRSGCDRNTGTCRKNPAVSCESSRDCVVGTKCSIKRSAEKCTDHGGVVSGSDSCCAECVPGATTTTTAPAATTTTATVPVTTTTSTTQPGSPSGVFVDVP
jgi:hypothetical protein